MESILLWFQGFPQLDRSQFGVGRGAEMRAGGFVPLSPPWVRDRDLQGVGLCSHPCQQGGGGENPAQGRTPPPPSLGRPQLQGSTGLGQGAPFPLLPCRDGGCRQDAGLGSRGLGTSAL